MESDTRGVRYSLQINTLDRTLEWGKARRRAVCLWGRAQEALVQAAAAEQATLEAATAGGGGGSDDGNGGAGEEEEEEEENVVSADIRSRRRARGQGGGLAWQGAGARLATAMHHEVRAAYGGVMPAHARTPQPDHRSACHSRP